MLHPIKDLPHNATLAFIYDTIESGHCECGGGTIACNGGEIGSLFVVKIAFPKLEMEGLLPQFENQGFCSRRSLAYMKPDNLDTFFPSPSKLLLAERRILDAELNNIKAENHRQPTQLELKRLNVIPSASTASTVKETS